MNYPSGTNAQIAHSCMKKDDDHVLARCLFWMTKVWKYQHLLMIIVFQRKNVNNKVKCKHDGTTAQC